MLLLTIFIKSINVKQYKLRKFTKIIVIFENSPKVLENKMKKFKEKKQNKTQLLINKNKFENQDLR